MTSESIHKAVLEEYITRQVNHFFPDGKDNRLVIRKNMAEALDRIQYSIKHVKLDGYKKFDILHSDLYAQFIYFLANTVWRNSQDKNTAGKLYYLNKALHGLNCLYDTVLPDIFLLIHCVGSVLGKAAYSNYFVACHNVTVGSDRGNSPTLAEGVYMGPGSSIIGKSVVGKFTHMTINSVLLNQNTDGECVIIGSSPAITSRKLKRNIIQEQYFQL